jgi:ribosomal-protein-alanine acetyltransferase
MALVGVADDLDSGLAGVGVAVLIPPQAELETIAVARLAQRRGIGACLLAELFENLKSRHITEVMLEVRESNGAARAFYASAGFAETSRRNSYYSDPKEDAILLARQIP